MWFLSLRIWGTLELFFSGVFCVKLNGVMHTFILFHQWDAT